MKLQKQRPYDSRGSASFPSPVSSASGRSSGSSRNAGLFSRPSINSEGTAASSVPTASKVPRKSLQERLATTGKRLFAKFSSNGIPAAPPSKLPEPMSELEFIHSKINMGGDPATLITLGFDPNIVFNHPGCELELSEALIEAASTAGCLHLLRQRFPEFDSNSMTRDANDNASSPDSLQQPVPAEANVADHALPNPHDPTQAESSSLVGNARDHIYIKGKLVRIVPSPVIAPPDPKLHPSALGYSFENDLHELNRESFAATNQATSLDPRSNSKIVGMPIGLIDSILHLPRAAFASVNDPSLVTLSSEKIDLIPVTQQPASRDPQVGSSNLGRSNVGSGATGADRLSSRAREALDSTLFHRNKALLALQGSDDDSGLGSHSGHRSLQFPERLSISTTSSGTQSSVALSRQTSNSNETVYREWLEAETRINGASSSSARSSVRTGDDSKRSSRASHISFHIPERLWTTRPPETRSPPVASKTKLSHLPAPKKATSRTTWLRRKIAITAARSGNS